MIPGNVYEFDIPPELKDRCFAKSPAFGLGYDAVLRRHDASNILLIDGVYHVWYTRYKEENQRSRGTFLTPGHTEIWLAVSEHGIHWTERGSVFPAVDDAWSNMGRHALHIVPKGGAIPCSRRKP